jgi:hypothetical protein
MKLVLVVSFDEATPKLENLISQLVNWENNHHPASEEAPVFVACFVCSCAFLESCFQKIQVVVVELVTVVVEEEYIL